ncbi:MAG: hypothetical protein SNJ59_12010 [Aggregatilineales bacterium]
MDGWFTEFAKVASIFALAFFSFWPAIPAGLALNLSPIVTIAVTSLSYASGAAVVIGVGGRVRAWALRRLGRGLVERDQTFIRRVWDRFGVVGLGLVAPVTIGAQIGAAFGIALYTRPRPLFFALSAGGLLWSILLTGLISLGVELTF